jgi:hypothetical protein
MFTRAASSWIGSTFSAAAAAAGAATTLAECQQDAGAGGGKDDAPPSAPPHQTSFGSRLPVVNFPASQLFVPAVPYPEWDPNWDHRKEKDKDKKDKGGGGGGSDGVAAAASGKSKPPKGPQRHIIMVRHGQYDETYPEDEKRILTPLGREQAAATGRRLFELLEAHRNIAERTGATPK